MAKISEHTCAASSTSNFLSGHKLNAQIAKPQLGINSANGGEMRNPDKVMDESRAFIFPTKNTNNLNCFIVCELGRWKIKFESKCELLIFAKDNCRRKYV